MNIDSHGHVIVPEILRTERNEEAWRPIVTRQPNGWQMVSNDRFANGPIPHEVLDPKRILDHMDAVNVDVMVASPPPFLFFWYLDGPTCLSACAIQNDGLAALAARYPKRFVPMGIVPLQDTDLAITEVDRLATELSMPAIEVPSHINGQYLGDRRLWPFWEAVQDLDLLVFVHPDEPYNLGIERLDRYYLHNLLGNPIDTARCIADVVFSGLLEAYPNIKFLFAHGGGALPYIRGRWDHGWNVRSEPKAHTQRPPNDSLGLLYFDTVTHWDRALEFLVDTAGADRVVMGSDYPFDMGSPDPVRFVHDVKGISDTDKNKIGCENAIKLLKLDWPA